MKTLLLFLLCGSAAFAAAVGEPAPAWQFTDLNGQKYSGDRLKGKVVVIDFWATWCAPCRREIPGYIALEKKYGAEGLVILGVSVDGGPDPVKRYASDHELNYPVGMITNQLYTSFNYPDSIPTTFLIDRQGVVREAKVGGESAAAFEKKVLGCLRP